MSRVHCRTFVVADPTDVLRETARRPILRFDDAAIAQVDELERMEALFRLSFIHGRGIGFRVDELEMAVVRFHWLGRSSAMALLSMPGDTRTLYLNLSGHNRDEEREAARYILELTHGHFSMGEVLPATGASGLIEFQLKGKGQFAFLCKLIHAAFWQVCEATFQQRRSQRMNLRRL